jgi:hypothetical protein
MMIKLGEKINYNNLLFLLETPNSLIIHTKRRIIGLAKVDAILVDYDLGEITIKSGNIKIRLTVDENDNVISVEMDGDLND